MGRRFLRACACWGVALVLAVGVSLGVHADRAFAGEPLQSVAMWRVYNPYSGEHLYTAQSGEVAHLSSLGWRYEGIGWYAPVESSTPVYRLYNPYSGDHHYTVDSGERNHLVSLGWIYEGVAWYSDDNQGVPLFRQFNPYVSIGTHNYTTSKSENDYLASIGWRPESVAWYGVDSAHVGTVVNCTPFMGDSRHSQEQVTSHLKAQLNARGREFPSEVYASYGAATADEFVARLFEAATAEGVRPDVMYAQAMLETGYLSFGGAVKPEQCNFCGLGATDSGDVPASFSSVYEGFLAQAQHLRAYSGKAPLSSTIVDPRYSTWLFGRSSTAAGTIEGLSGTWATDTSYGFKILTILNSI